MMRLCLLLVLGCTAAAAQQPVFRSGTTLVSIDASVTSQNKPVGGLGAADFALRDNGVLQQIDVVAVESLAIDVTLILDRGGRTAVDLDAFNQGVERIRAALRPADRVRLLAFDGTVQELSAMQSASAPLPLQSLKAGSSWTALYDALFLALAWPVEPTRRHLIVAFTDGFDTASTLPADTLTTLSARADAVMHVILSEAPPSRPSGGAGSSSRIQGGGVVEANPSLRQSERMLSRWNRSLGAVIEATKRTGGTTHHSGASTNAFETILSEFRSSYVLRYVPRGVPAGGWHDVDIRLTRRGSFTVRARKGYQG